MKIGVYGQVLKAEKLTGIGYYLYHLLSALSTIDQNNNYRIISNGPLAPTRTYPEKLQQAVHSKAINKGFLFLGFPQALKKEGCDLAFLPKELVPHRLPVPVVATAFDLFFLKLPQELKKEVSWDTKLHFRLAKTALKRASKILAISEDTKKDLVNLCGISPEHVVVTPLGCDPSFFQGISQEEADKILQKHQVSKPYFINTSSVWWGRKNLLRLIQAFSRFNMRCGGHQLIITGQAGPSEAAMKELICKEGLSEKIRLLHYVPRADLVTLLQQAEALVFPSLHEGFGLPVIEAMAAGCPVITSGNSALSEVATGAALLVDPYSTEEIEHAMESIVTDCSLRQSLVEKGKSRASLFTWEATAKKTLDVFTCSS